MKPLLPGKHLGVMGSGQLGRMFAQRAIQNGYYVSCYSPESSTPSFKAGVTEIIGEYNDSKKLNQFLSTISALTFEFENIPEEALRTIDEYSAKHGLVVAPSTESIRVSQNRFKEKSFFNGAGIGTTRFHYIGSVQEAERVIHQFNFPVIMKTNRFGYDGKGQVKFNSKEEFLDCVRNLTHFDHIIEEYVTFEKEVSVIAARFASGKILTYRPSENIHKDHILDLTIHPARIMPETEEKLIQHAVSLLEALNYVGVLGLEFFITNEGEILVNEFAPRPHNSGHFTMDAAPLSQFDLQLKALTNLEPSLESILSTHCVMKNLIGEDVLSYLRSDLEYLRNPDYHVHLYQKDKIKAGRKMGHINYTGSLDYNRAFNQ